MFHFISTLAGPAGEEIAGSRQRHSGNDTQIYSTWKKQLDGALPTTKRDINSRNETGKHRAGMSCLLASRG